MTLAVACTPDSGGGNESGGSTGSTGLATSTSTTPDPSTTDPGGTTEIGTGQDTTAGSEEGVDSTSTGAESTSTGPGCIPGEEEGCICEADECGVGLACEDDVCVAIPCGNGMIDDGEECDDANGMDNDGCDNDCTISEGAAAIEAGGEHVCAANHFGQMKCWGNFGQGRLGYPMQGEDIGDDEVPADFGYVDVGGVVEEMALGSDFTCVRLATDDVICWGEGQHGRLGQGNQDNLGIDEAPVDIDPISLSGTPIQIDAGDEHACAVFADGNVSCWGRNDHGQLGVPGENMIGDNELPSDVANVNVGANVEQIAAGLDHTCARLGGGDVLCWGRNNLGQLGVPGSESIGDNEDPATATMVMLDGEAINIDANYNHTCVWFPTGEIQCWGEGTQGKLGYGNEDDIGDDEEVNTQTTIDLDFNPTHLATGEDHTCARLLSTGIFCWGDGDNGRLGTGSPDDVLAPLMDQIDVSKAQGPGSVTAGAEFTCTRTTGSELKCWGRNNRGQLGQGAAFPTDLGDNESLSVANAIQFE
ncbi:MAG: hypothetical protein AAF799_34895 [Myxococcota bacterium]